jgi:hypothetical protein
MTLGRNREEAERLAETFAMETLVFLEEQLVTIQ